MPREVVELLALVEARHDALRERFGGQQDVARVVLLARRAGDLRLVLRPQLLLGGLAVLEVAIRERLLV